jgi:carbon storage regulator
VEFLDMLVISRKINENIAIGDNITVTVLAIEGDRIKIGIDAPRDVIILRQEIYQAVQDQVKIQELLAEESKPKALEQLRDLLVSETGKEIENTAISENPA